MSDPQVGKLYSCHMHPYLCIDHKPGTKKRVRRMMHWSNPKFTSYSDTEDVDVEEPPPKWTFIDLETSSKRTEGRVYIDWFHEVPANSSMQKKFTLWVLRKTKLPENLIQRIVTEYL